MTFWFNEQTNKVIVDSGMYVDLDLYHGELHLDVNAMSHDELESIIEAAKDALASDKNRGITA